MTASATIVVGYVPKPEGRAALERAVEEARLREASLVVVTSRRSAQEGTPAAEEEMAEVREVLTQSGVEFDLRPLVSVFDPAEDLIRTATEVEAQLLVIGLRRRSPVGKLVLGSNAQRILLDSPCSVLAVKP